jgi:hypothetical protein
MNIIKRCQSGLCEKEAARPVTFPVKKPHYSRESFTVTVMLCNHHARLVDDADLEKKLGVKEQ